MNNILYEIWFSSIDLSEKGDYIERFGSVEELYSVKSRTLIAEKIPYQDFLNITSENNKRKAEDIYIHCRSSGIRIISQKDDEYPILLRFIQNPPRILYVKGNIQNKEKCVAIVGSRTPSPYGLKCTRFFAEGIAEKGHIVTSGLARGIDSAAHKSVLGKGFSTYAVLGSGISSVYPKENLELAEEISRNGALISEYPPMSKPEKWHFPQRNRIISGMSHAVLIVEGKENSGSLITANHALDQGREVFCVPGNIFSENSKGVNLLINDGGRVVNHPDSINEYLEGIVY